MKLTETTVALAAFILSLVITGAETVRAWKGPEVDVVPPDQVLLYKSGAVLNLAVNLSVINNASGYSDLVTDARLRLERDGPIFPMTEIAVPVFNDEKSVSAQKQYCTAGSRCQRFRKMAVSQRAETVVTVPAGGAQTDFYSFELYCDTGEACPGFADFQEAIGSLKGRRLHLTVQLDLRRDGSRLIGCETPPIDEKGLSADGWQTLDCEAHSAAEIQGPP